MNIRYKFVQALSLSLAAVLQFAPVMRAILPGQGLAPSAWSCFLRIGVGATALLGFDAVSQASSISISPANATVGDPYVGTVTYSGGHAGSVSSMSLSNNCLGSLTTFFDGLSIVYNGGNTATVSGTPKAAGTYLFSIKVWDKSDCGGGDTDTRSTTLAIGAGSGGTVAPSNPTLANLCAQVGSTAILSGVSSGNPIPQYQWWQGLTPIPGATNSLLELTNVQLTNAGAYTLTASNSANLGEGILTLPKANCYLTVGISGGTNFGVLDYTNYVPAGVPLTMTSYFTNVATATNYYSWSYNGATTVESTSNTMPFNVSQAIPKSSGTWSVLFVSSNASGALIASGTNSFGQFVPGQEYDSYWAFGYVPVFTNALPVSTNVVAGASVNFSVAVGGSLNVYNGAGGTTGFVTNDAPCAFWYCNGTNLVGSEILTNGPVNGTTYSNSFVNASLSLLNLAPSNSGSYTVVVTNFWGSITSSPVVLSVSGTSYAPAIVANPPAALALLAGQSSSLSVNATGSPALFYQWRLGGTNLANGGVYAGVLTNTLSLHSVNIANQGRFSVVITNNFGAITSSDAKVSISSPPTVSADGTTPGTFRLNVSTATGLVYVVQMATNLVNPSWMLVQSNYTGTSGTISFQTNTGNSPEIFYRLVFP